MNAVIEMVPINQIADNPLRRKGDYPFNENKLTVLVHSMEDPDVGCWEGIIGRRKGKVVEQAFGHHRKEAGRRLGLKALPIIIRPLTDEQMLKFFGRENLEDYNADFLVMLQAWHAAEKYLLGKHSAPETGIKKGSQASDIARLLGWTRSYFDKDKKVNVFMFTTTAEACSLAAKLLADEQIEYSLLEGLSVEAVKELCGSISHQHDKIDKMAEVTGRSKRSVTTAKNIVNRAGKSVAKKVRSGNVAVKKIRTEVDSAAFVTAAKRKVKTPLFANFGRRLADQIATVAESDYLADKFNEIKKALDVGNVSDTEDFDVLDRIAFECGGASTRFSRWHNVFDKPDKRVVQMRAVEDQR